MLKPPDVQQVRDEILEQLAAGGDGLDHLPLRAFVTVADVYLSPEPSHRYRRAVFGGIAEQAPGQVLGFLAPLRAGDLRSLIFSLENALTAGGIDPQWRQMLTYAQQAA